MFEKVSTRSFSAEPEAVYRALQECAHSARHLLEADDGARAVTFQTGKSLFSWGHIVTAQVLDEPGGARLELVVTGLPEAPRALMDGKKNASMAAKVIEDVATRLP